MAIYAQRWFTVRTGSSDGPNTHPGAVAYELEFTGVGAQIWMTDTGENSGSALFDDTQQPMVGILVTSGSDRRVLSESGNYGVAQTEGAGNADEQWSYRVFWDATVAAWSVLIAFGGAIQSATTTDVPHDDGAIRTAIVTCWGVVDGWTAP